MSYTKNRECREHFTLGQIALMLRTAEKDENAKIWSTKNKKGINADFDLYEPDDFEEMASKIAPGEEQVHTFHRIGVIRKKHIKQDKVDFLSFSLPASSSSQSFVVQFSRHPKYDFPKMQVSVYQEEKDILKEVVVDAESKKFSFSPKKNGRYFLKITRLSDFMSGYQVKILSD